MPPVSILMFIFSAALLIYAALMAITKNYEILPMRARVSVKPRDPCAYTFQFAKVIALVALVPALTGLAAIFSGIAAGAVFVIGLVVTIFIGTRIMKDQM